MDEIMVASQSFPWWGSLLITLGVVGVVAVLMLKVMDTSTTIAMSFLVAMMAGVFSFAFPMLLTPTYDVAASSQALVEQAEAEYGVALGADTAAMLVGTVENGSMPEDGLVEEYQAVQFIDEQGEDQVLQLVWRGNAWVLTGEDGEPLEPEPDNGWR